MVWTGRENGVGAEESLRRGRTKQGVQQESKPARKKALAFVAAIREQSMERKTLPPSRDDRPVGAVRLLQPNAQCYITCVSGSYRCNSNVEATTKRSLFPRSSSSPLDGRCPWNVLCRLILGDSRNGRRFNPCTGCVYDDEYASQAGSRQVRF